MHLQRGYNHWMNRNIDLLIPPFLGEEPSCLSFCHPGSVLLFFTRANTTAESKVSLRSEDEAETQAQLRETCGD